MISFLDNSITFQSNKGTSPSPKQADCSITCTMISYSSMIVNYISITTNGVFKSTGLYSMLKSVILALFIICRSICCEYKVGVCVSRCKIAKVWLFPSVILIFRFDNYNVIPSIYCDLLRKDAVTTIIIHAK